jgi:hypothetical protein
MEIIVGIILALFTFIGIAVLIKVNRRRNKTIPVQEKTSTPSSGCCGAHEVCEIDQIKADETIIEYYDDEELDRYKNINENEYSTNQIDEFREVLYTLQTDEIRYWLLSIQRRSINLPSVLVSEARMLMAEA